MFKHSKIVRNGQAGKHSYVHPRTLHYAPAKKQGHSAFCYDYWYQVTHKPIVWTAKSQLLTWYKTDFTNGYLQLKNNNNNKQKLKTKQTHKLFPQQTAM